MTPFAIAWFCLGCLGIAGSLGVIVAHYRTKRDETAKEIYKDEAEAYKLKSERLEAMLADLTKRVEHLETENRMLRTLHDNSAALTQMSRTLADGFADIRSLLERGSQ